MKDLRLASSWFENEFGERLEVDFNNPYKEGFDYFNSISTNSITEYIFVKNKKISESSCTFSYDLIFAMCRPSDEEKKIQLKRNGKLPKLYEPNTAVVLCTSSCERCLNVLYYNYGLSNGYKLFSNEWYKSNTKCDFCLEYESEDYKRDIISEKPGKIIFLQSPSEELQIIASKKLINLPENIKSKKAIQSWENIKNMKKACE